MMDSRAGRLTMAAGGLIPGANGRKENVDAATAEKLGRLVDQDDELALDDRSLEMLVSIANQERRRAATGGKGGRVTGAGAGALTLDDVKAWVFWRQLHPPEGVPPEPEPEPLDAKFKIKLGFGGMPADASAQLSSSAEYDEEFHVVVNDDRGPDQPRSMTVWRLGGALGADTAVSSGVLHGCRAVRCHLPPGAFKLELANMPANIPDGQERSGSYFFLPAAHQSSEELVAFFNRCGEELPRVCTDDEHTVPGAAQHPDLDEKMMLRTWSGPPSSARHTWSAAAVDSGVTDSVRTLRGFEEPEVPVESRQPAAADVHVHCAKIVGTEEGENSKGAKVTHYLIECTPVPKSNQVAGAWTLRKRYSQFDEFRKQLETADRSSDASSLGLKQVPFPAKTWGIGVVGQGTVEQRRQKLEKWLNDIIGLNNAMLVSHQFELADAVHRFLRPESMALTMDQLQFANDPNAQSDVARSDLAQREAEHVATEESWKAHQITGEDGYLHTFEQKLFPSLTTHDDGEDSVVLDLQKVLASAAGNSEGGKVAKAEADRLVKNIQAELRSRDETISQLRIERDKLQKKLDGVAAQVADSSIQLFSVLGKSDEIKALQAIHDERKETD